MDEVKKVNPADFGGCIADGTKEFGTFRCVPSSIVTPDKVVNSYIIYEEFESNSRGGNRTVAEVPFSKCKSGAGSEMQCQKIRASEAALFTNSARMYELLAKILRLYHNNGFTGQFSFFTVDGEGTFDVKEIDSLFEKIDGDSELLLDGEMI